jgi:hypothetical protein
MVLRPPTLLVVEKNEKNFSLRCVLRDFEARPVDNFNFYLIQMWNYPPIIDV